MSDWRILEGDCIDVMASLPAASVDAVITSPPYAMQRAATYGGVPENDYPGWTVAWMEQARRILKPDGSAVINISPHLIEGGLSDYVLRTRLELRAAGWIECDELVWHKTDAPPLGSPARPRRAWESLLWYSRHPRPFSDPYAAGDAPVRQYARTGTDRSTRNGWGHVNSAAPVRDGAVARVTNVASIGKAKADPSADHPAVFPWQLAEWVGRLVCPPGGTVLDPFSGSGSTGVACLRNGWHHIGIEIDPGYAAMSRERLRSKPPTLFDVADLVEDDGINDLALFDV